MSSSPKQQESRQKPIEPDWEACLQQQLNNLEIREHQSRRNFEELRRQLQKQLFVRADGHRRVPGDPWDSRTPSPSWRTAIATVQLPGSTQTASKKP